MPGNSRSIRASRERARLMASIGVSWSRLRRIRQHFAAFAGFLDGRANLAEIGLDPRPLVLGQSIGFEGRYCPPQLLDALGGLQGCVVRRIGVARGERLRPLEQQLAGIVTKFDH